MSDLAIGGAALKAVKMLAARTQADEPAYCDDPADFADLRAAEAKGWVYGFGHHWSLTQAGREAVSP